MNTLFAQLKEAARIRYHRGELGAISSRQESSIGTLANLWVYIKIVPKQLPKDPYRICKKSSTLFSAVCKT